MLVMQLTDGHRDDRHDGHHDDRRWEELVCALKLHWKCSLLVISSVAAAIVVVVIVIIVVVIVVVITGERRIST